MLKTVIVLISHQSPAEVSAMCRTWQDLNPDTLVHVAYGGPAETFAALTWPHCSYIQDPRLRTRDHQRERQSYRGLMQETAAALAASRIDRVLMAECDVVPLRPGLAAYLIQREEEEQAQVLGSRLRRVDGTSHPHFLAHASHPSYQEWLKGSVRRDQEVLLMMLGCLTWWTWEAFAATATAPEPMPVYLELALPTTPHLLGFRVRDLPEFASDMEPVGELEGEVAQRRAAGRWVVHPCKKAWRGHQASPPG
jgi:hypothetical protein